MSTQRQRRRGTAAEHASFTGAAGEITYDTTNNRAVGHDGATAGGYPHQTVAGHRRQDGIWMDVAGSGSPVNYNVLIGSVSPVPAALVTGMALEFLPPGANTGAVTIDVGDDAGAGAKAIQSGGAALSAGQLDPATPVRIVYDGTAWQVAGGTAGGLVPLETQTVGSAVASVDFTDIPYGTYKQFVVRISGLVPATDNTALLMRMGVDGGSLGSGAADYEWTTASQVSGSTTYSGGGDTADSSITLAAGVGNSAPESLNGIVNLANLASTSQYKIVSSHSCFVTATTDNAASVEAAGQYQGNTGAVDKISFFMSSGNIAAGTFELFGIKGA